MTIEERAKKWFDPNRAGYERLVKDFRAVEVQTRKQGHCPHGDPVCPCQDGDVCHYEGIAPWEYPKVTQARNDRDELWRKALTNAGSGWGDTPWCPMFVNAVKEEFSRIDRKKL